MKILTPAQFMADETPRPLMREIPPAEPFPVHHLGDVLAPAANAIRDRIAAPMAICAQSALAVAALAVQGHADIELPIGPGQRKPLSLFLMTVAETGERKSAVDEQAMAPVWKREAALREKRDDQLLYYTNDKAAYDKARQAAERNGKGDRIAIREALNALGPPPEPPLEPMLTCAEPTFEGLYKLLAAGHPSVGIFSSEGGAFIGGHGMTEEAKLRTATGLCDLWDGQPVKRVRAGDGVSILPGRRVSCTCRRKAPSPISGYATNCSTARDCYPAS
jgi:hypothetical protein